jgi:uncharacterized protein (DUF362 family)
LRYDVEKISRREFLEKAGKLGAGAFLFGALSRIKGPLLPSLKDKPVDDNNTDADADAPYLSVVRGKDPEAITRKAIDAIGGIGRFVKKGANVIVKPNICTDYYSFEYAATSNPIVVATIVKMCLEAGAKRVRVMDNTVRGSGNAAKGYKISGIEDAVKKAGGTMEIMNPIKFRETEIPAGKRIKSWPIYQDIMKADVLINVAIPKDHPATEVTVGCKNLMGVIGSPTKFHDSDISQKIADLVSVVQPELTVIDAVRILVQNGPTGGSLSDVKITNTVIASHDILAADSYALRLFNMKGEDLLHIKLAREMGLGRTDLSAIKIAEFNI